MVLPLPSFQLILAIFLVASVIAYFKDRPPLKCGSCVAPYCDEYSTETVNCTGLCLTEKLGGEILSKRCASWQELNSPLRYATSFFGVSVESRHFMNGSIFCFCNGKDNCSCDTESYFSKVKSAFSNLSWWRIFELLDFLIQLADFISEVKKDPDVQDAMSNAQEAMSKIDRKMREVGAKIEAKLEKFESKMEKASKKLLGRLF